MGTARSLPQIISRCFCYSCLVEFLRRRCYTVKFDAEPQADTLRWLDIVVSMEERTVGIKDTLFEVSPAWCVQQKHLRALLAGRMARYQQLQLSTEQWQTDLAHCMLRLVYQGFTRHRLRNLAFTLWRPQFSYMIDFLKSFVCCKVFRDLCH